MVSEIIDFNRQPDIFFDSGKDAESLQLSIMDKLLILSSTVLGTEYNTPPHLKIISETGDFAY